jgi:decaprenylphospho-beta-D-ribofuranose 2-oxidase
MDERPTRLTGWGRNTSSLGTLISVDRPEQVAELVRRAPTRGLLARGLGRAYGDAATNAGGSLLAPLGPDQDITVDEAAPSVTAAAGVSIDRLLATVLPRGLMLPVLPGTRHVSLGGALAADIHGKNHHHDGSFGRWVDALTLVDGAGEVRRLAPTSDPHLFWATVGGMGLTGVIVQATVRLLRVDTSWIRVTTSRVPDLEELLARLGTGPAPRYQVAWVDCLAGGRHRALLDEGEHLPAAELPGRHADRPLAVPVRRPAPAPPLPASLVTPSVVKAFNAAWWHRAPVARTAAVPVDSFFFPLDRLAHWNRLYGPRGFLQYQLVVPTAAGELLRKVLDILLAVGGLPSLVVLKRMGPAAPGPLSFPADGWTLAVDLPADPRLAGPLDTVDGWVAEAGGRVYLAKDSRARPAAIAAMYPGLDAWRSARAQLDPAQRFCSDLARRTGLA